MRFVILGSGPARGPGRLDARLAAAAATAVVLAPAPVELALLPGLVLGAHDAEDEVEQPDQRDLEAENQPEEPELVTHLAGRLPRPQAPRQPNWCDMLAR